MRSLSILVVLFTFAALPACTSEESDDAAGEEDELKAKAVEVSEADQGKTIGLEKGKRLQLSLPSNATTGYRWKVVSTTKTFGYPSPKDGSYSGPGANGPVGGGGKQVFLWTSTSPLLMPSSTSHAIKLEYRRSFESDDVPAAKSFSFKVKVKAATPEQPEAPPALRPIVLFEEHDHSTIRAQRGQDVVVRLPANPSAGYNWHVESVDRTLGYPQVDFQVSQPGAVGSGGTAILTWKTAGPLDTTGHHEVKLKYSRGAGGAASKTFSFALDIAAADDGLFECPPESRRSINCMPPVSAGNRAYCTSDYRAWAEGSCDVQFLD